MLFRGAAFEYAQKTATFKRWLYLITCVPVTDVFFTFPEMREESS